MDLCWQRQWILISLLLMNVADLDIHCFLEKEFIIIPPANFVCGGVYCFHVVRACVRPSVRNVFLTWRVIAGFSSNIANMFIYARQIL